MISFSVFSSSSVSPFSELTVRDLDRFTTRDKFVSAPSSMVPTLLYTSKEHSNRESKKIFVSWFSSSSKAPNPSVSIISTGLVLSLSLGEKNT